MQGIMNVILALSKLANSPEGQTVLSFIGAGIYDLVRRYSKTKNPAGLLWSLHHGLKWVSEITGNSAQALDRVLGQRVHEKEDPQ